MTRRSQRGGAYAPEERQEAVALVGGKEKSPWISRPKTTKIFTLRSLFFHLDYKRTLRTLSQHLPVNKETLARQRGMMEDLEAESCGESYQDATTSPHCKSFREQSLGFVEIPQASRGNAKSERTKIKQGNEE